MKDPKEKHIQL